MPKTNDSIRVNLYVAPKYLEFFDAYANDMNLSRSAAFTVMIRDYMRISESKEFMEKGAEVTEKLSELQKKLQDAQSIT